ncbi:hypothetical protein MXF26_20345 [Pantoea dispersa]|nr:hypothetical protein [Pantoea dispersa]MEB5838600.1 hypothetical protein [Pantoea dispersa]
MHYRLVQRIQLLFQQVQPFADDLLIFSALAGTLDLPAQIIDLAGINDLRRSAQPMQR